MANATIRAERELSVLGVASRAFPIIASDNGRILNQTIKTGKYYKENGHEYRITVELRFDDQCRNGHETFAITADIREDGREYMAGCCHEEIVKRFPAFEPLIKWHLTSTDGPMHYLANTLYHVEQHGPDHAWVYYTAPVSDPLRILPNKDAERLLRYAPRAEAERAEGQPGYRVEWDQKTVKVRNLDHARSCAVWPEASDDDLTAPGLKQRLEARLPALMDQFKADMLEAGFVWPEIKQREAA